MRAAILSLLAVVAGCAAPQAAPTHTDARIPPPTLVSTERTVGVHIATRAEAAAILSAHDNVMQAMTPSDFSILLNRPQGGTVQEVEALFAAEAQDWTPEESARLEALYRRVEPRLRTLVAWLPNQVVLIKASARVEGGLPHTRGEAIIFGPRLPANDAQLDALFFHELFHVLSRRNAARHDEMYALIGFEPCTRMDLPADVTASFLTNPDAPTINYAMHADGQPADIYLTPVLTAKPTRFEAGKPHFTDYFDLSFFKLRRDAQGVCHAIVDHGAPVTFPPPQAMPMLFAHAGSNTDYVLHPEETMADNFEQLMIAKPDVPSPEIQDRLAAFLGVPGRAARH